MNLARAATLKRSHQPRAPHSRSLLGYASWPDRLDKQRMIPPRLQSKDYLGAALLILMGCAVAFIGRSYRMGSLTDMGAGFIPTALGILMAAVGLLIGLTARPALGTTLIVPHGQEPRAFELRAWGFILAGIAAFVLLGTFGGFVPASFACVFICALGDRQNSLRDTFLLACLLVAAGYLIFHWGLNLQFDAFKWG
jgi:hypothetical protein